MSSCNETAKLSESSPCNAFGRTAWEPWRLSVRGHPLLWDVGSCFPVVHKLIALRTRVVCRVHRLTITLARDCTVQKSNSKPGRGAGEPMSWFDVRRCSTQLTSGHLNTRHVLASGSAQSRQDPSFPRRSGIRHSIRWYSASFSGSQEIQLPAPFAGRRLNTVVPPNQGSGIIGVFDGAFGVFHWPSTCQCRRAAYSILLFRPFQHFARCDT